MTGHRPRTRASVPLRLQRETQPVLMREVVTPKSRFGVVLAVAVLFFCSASGSVLAASLAYAIWG